MIANELRWFWEANTVGSEAVEEMRRAPRIFGKPRFRALRRALELDGVGAVDAATPAATEVVAHATAMRYR